MRRRQRSNRSAKRVLGADLNVPRCSAWTAAWMRLFLVVLRSFWEASRIGMFAGEAKGVAVFFLFFLVGGGARIEGCCEGGRAQRSARRDRTGALSLESRIHKLQQADLDSELWQKSADDCLLASLRNRALAAVVRRHRAPPLLLNHQVAGDPPPYRGAPASTA